jgi:CHASE3 domain sensor protein
MAIPSSNSASPQGDIAAVKEEREEMTTLEAAPARNGFGNPINSVRRCLIAGFGLLVLILIAVVAGSTWMVKEHQADSARMAEKADTALLLQGTESHVGTAGLMLQRFSIDGNGIWIEEIITAADAASKNMATVRSRAETDNDIALLARLDELDTT